MSKKVFRHAAIALVLIISFSSCIWNATLKIVSCGNITLNNVTVASGAKLILDAVGEVFTEGIDVQAGGEFEVLD